MSKQDEWQELWAQGRIFLGWTVAILFDTIFLVVWVAAQWITQQVVNRLRLEGIDQWVLITFQVVFGISTLAIVLIYIIGDILVMFYRTRRRVEQERDRKDNE